SQWGSRSPASKFPRSAAPLAARAGLGQSGSVKTLIALACLVCACSSNPLDAGSTAGGGSGSVMAGPGTGGTDTAAAAGASGTDVPFNDSCSAARAQQIGAIASVSTGKVQLLSDTGGVKTLYVDATAGGQNGTTTHPWTYVALATASKVELDDPSSVHSLAWDLAFKRALIYSNGGQGGPGNGASAFLDKDFASVTRADAADAQFYSEQFFDDDCNPYVDITGATSTSFSTWYNYDEASHMLSPVAGTWLVQGAAGKLYKLRVKSYYATPSGGTGSAGGAYLLEIGAL
ncbi:MAG TPA: HmuY family protein, partial [Polyangiaceae bacterium]|nr:HmuY family protein [Polyangiaceae bacterium]